MKHLLYFICIVIFTACNNVPKKEIEMPYTNADFEKTIDGKATRLFEMENKNGVVVTLTNYGAKIVSIYVPDKNGKFDDILLGFKSIDDYQKGSAGHGAVVGPYANRISGAKFTINDKTYNLPVNNGEACLHSGPNSWYRKVWDYEKMENTTTFMLHSPDGEFGFPGNKTVRVIYTLTDDNELKIDYEVTTDEYTHINITNHSYFNLRGEGNGNILDHIVVIDADKVTPVVDKWMIPTGEVADIRGTDLDFTSPHRIGERINSDNPQIVFASGYDFNYVINKENRVMAFAASAYEPESGRYMEVFTTEPGVQLYTANSMNGSEIGKSGKPYIKNGGFCFETQHFPDTPNQPSFPSTLLKPGEMYKSTTIFKFSVKES
jgi:aldose 1-epimerase